MMVNMAFSGALYLIPFFGEKVLGKTALEVGWFLLISPVVTTIIGMPVSAWSDRLGNRRMFCVLAGAFTAITFVLYAIFARDMTDPIFFIICVIDGLGWGFVGGPMASRLVESAGEERNMASALVNEAVFIGGAMGTALIAMLFTLCSG